MTRSNIVKLPNARSPESWAEKINNTWRERLPSIFETGVLLETAKCELAHGEWTALFREGNMPFGQNTAFRLIAIADNKNLRNVDHGQCLPVAWQTLYELTKLTDQQFDDGIKSGVINPKMQRRDVAELRGIAPKKAEPKKKEQPPKTLDDWCGELIVQLTEATALVSGEERSELFARMRRALTSLEAEIG